MILGFPIYPSIPTFKLYITFHKVAISSPSFPQFLDPMSSAKARSIISKIPYGLKLWIFLLGIFTSLLGILLPSSLHIGLLPSLTSPIHLARRWWKCPFFIAVSRPFSLLLQKIPELQNSGHLTIPLATLDHSSLPHSLKTLAPDWFPTLSSATLAVILSDSNVHVDDLSSTLASGFLKFLSSIDVYLHQH